MWSFSGDATLLVLLQYSMSAQFWSEFYRRRGYNSRLKLQICLENCLDVFTGSHFQVKFWSVLSIFSIYLFVSLISLLVVVFPCYLAGENLHPGKINQCYFFPIFFAQIFSILVT